MTQIIDRFDGCYSFLSNFHPAVVRMDTFGLQKYPSVEHAYQAAKTLNLKLREAFMDSYLSAGDAKKMGRELKIRPDWEFIKLEVMNNLVRQKFLQPGFTRQLLETKDATLEEGNYWHDNYWGKCICPKCKGKTKLNHLGLLLMKVRGELSEFRVIYDLVTLKRIFDPTEDLVPIA